MHFVLTYLTIQERKKKCPYKQHENNYLTCRQFLQHILTLSGSGHNILHFHHDN